MILGKRHRAKTTSARTRIILGHSYLQQCGKMLFAPLFFLLLQYRSRPLIKLATLVSTSTDPSIVCPCCVGLQLENQDSMKSLLKRTEAELNVRVADALRKLEDPLQRQRLLVEEERLKYLNEEELIIQQLQSVTLRAADTHSTLVAAAEGEYFFKLSFN